MKNLTVNLKPSTDFNYDIRIQRGLLDKTGENIKNIFHGKNIYIVTDSNVAPLYAEKVANSLKDCGYIVYTYAFKAGEESKNLAGLNDIYKFLIRDGASRKDLIVALGGGVVGDMAGFAAATYMRGVRYVQIPTTLLSQIDSSVGGKVAVNLPEGKNLVGAFYHPELVLIDPDCLTTLPQRELAGGAAEALKYGYIGDRVLYDMFQSLTSLNDIYPHIDEIIYRSCDMKRAVVEEDEKESGLRMILNFGHTVGHAYESYYNYEKYTHGEAVALGMMFICKLAERKGISSKGMSVDLKNILNVLTLPTEDDGDINVILQNVFKDKKSNSEYTSFILPRKIGEVFIEKVPSDKVMYFLKD